ARRWHARLLDEGRQRPLDLRYQQGVHDDQRREGERRRPGGARRNRLGRNALLQLGLWRVRRQRRQRAARIRHRLVLEVRDRRPGANRGECFGQACWSMARLRGVDQAGLRSSIWFRTVKKRNHMRRAVCAIILVLSCASAASAQLLAAKDGPIVYGHHHIAASDIPAHLKFFADALGGTRIKFGPQQVDVVKFPNVFIFFRNQKPTGGSKGTTVNHIGFSVPNLRETLERLGAAGYPVTFVNEPVINNTAPPNHVFVMGPDDVMVGLIEKNEQTTPIALHSVDFVGSLEMRDWYVKVFGAKPLPSGRFLAAGLPGVVLTFSPSRDPVIGTTGRSIEHIGFEVRDLEAFCKKLEAMGIKLNVTYRKSEAFGLGIAFVTDPWGTSIELNEGLDKLQ